MKNKTKARLMWACPEYSPDIKAKRSALWNHCKVIPVAVIDVSDPEALVNAFAQTWLDGIADMAKLKRMAVKEPHIERARRCLTSLGILPKKRRGAKDGK